MSPRGVVSVRAAVLGGAVTAVDRRDRGRNRRVFGDGWKVVVRRALPPFPDYLQSSGYGKGGSAHSGQSVGVEPSPALWFPPTTPVAGNCRSVAFLLIDQADRPVSRWKYSHAGRACQYEKLRGKDIPQRHWKSAIAAAVLFDSRRSPRYDIGWDRRAAGPLFGTSQRERSDQWRRNRYSSTRRSTTVGWSS